MKSVRTITLYSKSVSARLWPSARIPISFCWRDAGVSVKLFKTTSVGWMPVTKCLFSTLPARTHEPSAHWTGLTQYACITNDKNWPKMENACTSVKWAFSEMNHHQDVLSVVHNIKFLYLWTSGRLPICKRCTRNGLWKKFVLLNAINVKVRKRALHKLIFTHSVELDAPWKPCIKFNIR